MKLNFVVVNLSPVTHFEFSDSRGFLTICKPEWKSALEFAKRHAEDSHVMVDIYQSEWVVESRREFPDVSHICYRQRLNWIYRVDGRDGRAR